MAFTESELVPIREAMAEFIDHHRPPEHLRQQVDLDWRIEGQSVVIFNIRPALVSPERKIEDAVAKATYVRRAKEWKIFWQRADLKWHSYPPYPEAVLFEEFLAVVDEDESSCFWG
jgi:hypothetical protein